MNDSPTELGELTVVRIFEARPEVVFECMTTPSHLTHFWGPIGMSTPLERITVEPRTGGRFETVMVNDETGEEYPVRGVFVEFDPPRTFAFTEAGVEGGMTTAIVFNDLCDGRTETVTHQTNVPSILMSPEARAGLETSFVKLDAYLATL
ncbi:MAG: SRPBCC domain-containing protein [Acidimicrobiales bacterium]